MAGAPGFEPGNDGTKNRCLTAWLRPKMMAGSLARKIAKVKVQLALPHNLAVTGLLSLACCDLACSHLAHCVLGAQRAIAAK